ncbi:glycosyltransferase family 4 protein [Dendronalium sp. ChiSLP03b]|uniref:glycosyltransferase family 4 protein n=1 Tax=Dendronalium sp. ChiSLP03b TaxID=3075381 RepID=UPI002AD2EF09|nr:glycosyltransferase family 4 protein [Dendronalium sp. ChiSLP03b]MDZ8204875.1 glycosyltransferase family 4 protein [Dendronalium sp. ChiSLP03b]
MKILLFGAITPKGGIQTHMRFLSKMLADSGVKVLIIAPQLIEEEEPNQDGFVKNGIQLLYLKCDNSKVSKLSKFKEIIKAANNFKPDVYYGIGTGWNLSLLPLILPKRVRSIFHEVMSGIPCGWNDPRWGVKWCFDEVVGQSPTVANTFVEYFGWQKKIASLPAIPEPLEITARLPQIKPKSVEIGKAKAALFSRLVPHKRSFWLVQQWDLLKDVLSELHIHGTGLEEPLIRQYIEANGIGDRVKCFGRYPEGQAYVDLISSYDLTLLPTLGDEGAPLVLLESLACGVPFVTYGVGGIADYGVNNPNVIIVPAEPWQNEQAKDAATTANTDNLFINAVRKMLFQLAEGEINQVELQKYYLDRYSYSVLKKAWLSYLCG